MVEIRPRFDILRGLRKRQRAELLKIADRVERQFVQRAALEIRRLQWIADRRRRWWGDFELRDAPRGQLRHDTFEIADQVYDAPVVDDDRIAATGASIDGDRAAADRGAAHGPGKQGAERRRQRFGDGRLTAYRTGREQGARVRQDRDLGRCLNQIVEPPGAPAANTNA